MGFDKLKKSEFNGKKIIYGAMLAPRPSSTVLLIKKGQDKEKNVKAEKIEKHVRGYDDKYLNMARYYRDEKNITVFVASNPFDGFDSICDAVDVIGEYFQKNGISEGERRILCFGHSFGATALAMYAQHYSQITDVILVNMPILPLFEEMIKDGVRTLNKRDNLTIIYGEDDQSYLNGNDETLQDAVDDLNILIEEGADHDFSEATETFMRLPDLFWKHIKE